ncbi:hypothetical protein GCM10022198_16410 [Klugiella xanthotipulae]|uniref:Leucine rich repeat variant domain-containing protein n=1 Tax=Klugiella xanthotipulae TaxID=244735 RepID=A0A543HHB1_9MICO|nr:hypothetical protein [Klugiella xanthotipulae]TQM57677.1 hypothetical protein FB466_2673 [Klugiella xanthotipulae]
MSSTPHDILREANDPTTVPARLAEIAAQYPEAHAAVAAHPHCYPGLLEWLSRAGDATTRQIANDRLAQAAADPAVFRSSATAAAPPSVMQPTAVQPTAVQPSVMQPTQAYPTQAYPVPAQPGPPRTPRRPRRGLVLGLVAGALVLVLTGGGVAWALFFSKLGGAASPEAAADKLVTALVNADLVSAYGALAPSEIEAIRPSLERLASIRVDDDTTAGDEDLSDAVQPALDSFDISMDGWSYETESLGADIEVVRLVAGSLTIDGDPAAIANAATALQRSQAEVTGQPTSALDRQRDEIKSTLEAKLPYTITAAEMADELGFDPRLVTVREGDSWYVSPVLTAGDYAYQDGDYGDYGSVPTGDEVARYDTPEDAADGLTEALSRSMETGSTDDLAASLPLVERRFVGLYGEMMFGDPVVGAPQLTPGFEAETSGDTARVQFKDFILSLSFLGTSLKYTVNGLCVTADSAYSDSTSCLDDLDGVHLDRLDVSEWRIIAVRQDGGWFVSPLSTVADIASITTKRIVELSEAGELDTIFG